MRDVEPIEVLESIRQGLLVLDSDLTVRFANRSFYHMFAASPERTIGRKLYDLGNGQWDIPELRNLVQTVVLADVTFALKVAEVFSSIGRRMVLLNGRRVYRPGGDVVQILMEVEDISERRLPEREDSSARQPMEILLKELTHRVKNSLQTIGSIVRIEARHHRSGEGRGA